MSSTLMERTGMAVPGMGVPGVVSPSAMPAGVSYQMVPRCTFKVERCQDGMKVSCTCEDQLACSTMQNLCSVLATCPNDYVLCGLHNLQGEPKRILVRCQCVLRARQGLERFILLRHDNLKVRYCNRVDNL